MTRLPEVVAGAQPWWREAVFYQIYPLSFMDSDGDGFGDLKGITSKLDYLSDTLGVDAIWLSPFYRSPMRDWGYDISDHTDVDPLFGDIDDARQFLAAAHERGIKVIIDYVPNHSSNKHPWFVESRSSIDNPKRDWYVWRDGKPDGGPPTNWVSVFSGPAWSFDDVTDQWHRNTYLPEQPDLNWRNPELVGAMHEVARFWMDIGFDGFRVDAAHQMMKDPQERDNPPVPADFEEPFKNMGEYDTFEHLYDLGHPDVHEVHRRFQAVLDEYDGDRMSVGEVHIFDIAEWAEYYGPNLDQLTMPFNFHLMACDWDAVSIRILVESVFRNIPAGAWTNWTLGNHDEIRLASRLPEGHERLAALLLLTLRGSPFLYYGDELGMKQTAVSPQQGRDPWGANVEYLSRDGERTPMQWSGATNAGFAPQTAEPWLPVAADYETVNVESALTDPESTLNMYRRLLALRRGSVAVTRGSFAIDSSSSEHVLVYRRDAGDESVTVALNFTDQVRSFRLPSGSVVFSTIGRHRDDRIVGTVDLAPREGVIVEHPH